MRRGQIVVAALTRFSAASWARLCRRAVATTADVAGDESCRAGLAPALALRETAHPFGGEGAGMSGLSRATRGSSSGFEIDL